MASINPATGETIARVQLMREAGGVQLCLGENNIPVDFVGPTPQPDDAPLLLGVRPESVRVAREATGGYFQIEAHLIEPLGAYDIVDLRLGGQFLRARTASGFVSHPGQTVWAQLDAVQTHFFSAKSGNVLDTGPR